MVLYVQRIQIFKSFYQKIVLEQQYIKNDKNIRNKERNIRHHKHHKNDNFQNNSYQHNKDIHKNEI